MKKIIFSIVLAFSVLSGFGLQTASAADPASMVAATRNCSKSFLGLPTWYKYLQLDDNCSVIIPRVEAEDGSSRPDFAWVGSRVALAVIDILLRIGGMVAFGFIVYSGFRFVMSQGNSDQEKAARETAINAVIGMVITIFAVLVVSYVGRRISG